MRAVEGKVVLFVDCVEIVTAMAKLAHHSLHYAPLTRRISLELNTLRTQGLHLCKLCQQLEFRSEAWLRGGPFRKERGISVQTTAGAYCIETATKPQLWSKASSHRCGIAHRGKHRKCKCLPILLSELLKFAYCVL